MSGRKINLKIFFSSFEMIPFSIFIIIFFKNFFFFQKSMYLCSSVLLKNRQKKVERRKIGGKCER